MSTRYYLVLAITLLYAPWGFAIDCVKSFDQSCLSEEYNSDKVEADHQQQQQNLEVHCKTTKEEEEEERIAYLEHEANKRTAIENFLTMPTVLYHAANPVLRAGFNSEKINADGARQIEITMDQDFLQRLANQKRLNLECRKAEAMRERNKAVQ